MENIVIYIVIALVILGILSRSFGIAKEWEKHAVFFLGKLSRIVGPGFYITKVSHKNK
ncbi:MAG: hypothetical protein KAI29_06875 [Cyclobacteriaceae bacterium]|nr:hypothetical protein [Cyclobacteriaceae bacterium]